jgi:hypothetical protein
VFDGVFRQLMFPYLPVNFQTISLIHSIFLNISSTTLIFAIIVSRHRLVKWKAVSVSHDPQWISNVSFVGLLIFKMCFNLLKQKLVKIIFKNLVRTAKKTQLFTITKINWLTLFKKIIAVYSENHTKHKYKMKSYWLLKQGGGGIQLPLCFKGLWFLLTFHAISAVILHLTGSNEVRIDG